MLVGSIGWSKCAGEKVAKGEDLGWFQVNPSAILGTQAEDLSTAAQRSYVSFLLQRVSNSTTTY